MKYNLWLDDQINDPDTPERWTPEGYVGAESTEKAKALVLEFGVPEFMNLDHDLGEGDDALEFLKWLTENYYTEIPGYAVHSANPVGRDRIHSHMRSWERSFY